jgi:hypothetical protein
LFHFKVLDTGLVKQDTPINLRMLNLKEALEGEGFLIGRFGTIEFDVLWGNKTNSITHDRMSVLERNAGVFPSEPLVVKRWCSEYEEAVKSADILATGWYEPIKKKEQVYLKEIGWDGKQVPLRALEPYYHKELWTHELEGQKVCVVSSFTDTIQSQLKKPGLWPNGLWPNRFWPSIQWSFVKTGYAPCLAMGRAGWECENESWVECVDYVVSEVVRENPRVVIIGCGGLGMIIASRLKKLGKICLVLGGATQVLFGIKGRRWESHELSRFWNSEWVGPSIEETPAGANQVEKGCYWF